MIGIILIKIFLFVHKKKLKQNTAQVAMEDSFNQTFVNRTFLKSI